MGETDDERARQQIATGLALVTMGLLAVGLLAAGVWWWWIAFPIGGGLIPLAQGLAAQYDTDETDESSSDDGPQGALDELRSRYARGEMTEAEFESRLERLLETETVGNARESLERGRVRDREREVE